MNTALVIIAVILVPVIIAAIWLGKTLKWIDEKTGEDRFYQLPLAERLALRKNIEAKARIITLLTYPLTKLGMAMPVVDFDNTKVPAICPAESMQFAKDYQPQPEDIFVATQMKCGTTWMQQIVHQLVTKGEGEFTDDGHRHLYTISPWIESRGSVRLENAPLINGRRIVKTHLGTNLCPYSDKAKYIYVVRHPNACLASSIDFVTMLMGRMAPQYGKFCDWFCSDDMWWRSWPEHADGWWRWSQQYDNVLFVHYEHLLEAPAEQMRKIANFLGVELTDAELANAVEKSSYQYMKDNEHYFEMSPPTPMHVGSKSYFVSGKKDRGNDITEADQARVLAFCRERLEGASYPAAEFYPDLAQS